MSARPAPEGVDIPRLAQTRVFAGPDQPLLAGQLWRKQAVILVFLRHFACIGCRSHAAQVWGEREKYERSGARIVFIGNGQPRWIEIFREDLGIARGVVLTDPSLQSFQAAGLKHGFFRLLQPRSALNMLQLARAGYSQRPHEPDAGTHWQMGGILAVGTQGQVLYHFASRAVGDVPSEPHLSVIHEDEAGL